MSEASVAGKSLEPVVSARAPQPGGGGGARLGVWQKRWKKFRGDRRAFISLVLFCVIALAAFLAPIAANNEPLVVVVGDDTFYPFLETVSEKDIGGALPLRADFSDPGTAELVGERGRIIWPLVRYSYDTVDFYSWQQHPTAPSAAHPFGTDDQARDVFARVLYGLRISLWFGLLLTAITVSVGIAAGTVQGYFGGYVDLSFQRFMEIWESMPQLYVLIIVSSILVPSFLSLLILLSVFGWTGVVGVVRAEVLRVRRLDYVSAARAMGVPSHLLMARHVAPNALVAAMTVLPFVATGSIVSLASLDFLGFGLPTGAPSLGELLQQGRNNLNAPWLGMTAFGSLAVLLTLLVFIGEGLREVFDPRRVPITRVSKAAASLPLPVSSHADHLAQSGKNLLAVRGLSVRAGGDFGDVLVDDVTFEIARGEIVGLVGESGSGKSLTARSLIDILPGGVGFAPGGEMAFDNHAIGFGSAAQARLRGLKIGFVPQEPMSSLNPVHTVKRQILEALQVGGRDSAADARGQRIEELLERVGLGHLHDRINGYPHQFSGGERQRIVIAIAIANNPDLLIADEPTTALDVLLQVQILNLFADLRRDLGIAILFVSHDLPAVGSLADRVLVMDSGKIVEQGPAVQVLTNPQSAQARMLVGNAARPAKMSDRGNIPAADAINPVLDVRDVSVAFPVASKGWWPGQSSFTAVDDVSFYLKPGETLGLVGASGSGKTTLGRAILNMLPHTGDIALAPHAVPHASGSYRPASSAQIVFQDPFSSLSPRMTIGDIIREPLDLQATHLSKKERVQLVAQMLDRVGLAPHSAHRYPHEFSGGQRQRIAIARALIVQPKVVVLDEPTSALDASVQASVLDLLSDLQRETGAAYLLITHDFSVLARIADRVAVMKEGRIVETGARDDVFHHPNHPYTQTLLEAARQLNPAVFDA